MKKKAITGALALLLLALLVWAFSPTPTVVEVASVSVGRFERSVQEDGQTRLRERYVVSTPLTGRVARIELKPGDAVQFGATVATLWPVAPALLDERTRAEQMAHIGAMQANLTKTQANVARAAAALGQASADLKRSETLAQQGFISPYQNEADRLTVRLRQQELASARQEQTAAQHTLEQARIAVQQFSAGVPDTRQRTYPVPAPVSGKVLKILQPSEGLVPAGTALMELGDPSRLEVVVDLLTEDAAQIKPGTAVQLSNWGGVEVLDGRVRLIEPAAFTKISALGVEEQRVNAIIDILTAPEQWRSLGDGFKLDVRVLVQVVPDAVMVPVSALFPRGTRSGLFVLEQDRARLQEIEIAARNGVQAWVKSGLSVGTPVIVYPDSQLKDGDRVTTR